MNWLLRWHLRRAENALDKARQRREALDKANPEYGGLLVDQIAEELRLERRVAELKVRLELRS